MMPVVKRLCCACEEHVRNFLLSNFMFLNVMHSLLSLPRTCVRAKAAKPQCAHPVHVSAVHIMQILCHSEKLSTSPTPGPTHEDTG